MQRIVVIGFLVAGLCLNSTDATAGRRTEVVVKNNWGLTCAISLTASLIAFTFGGALNVKPVDSLTPPPAKVERLADKPSRFPLDAKVAAFFPTGNPQAPFTVNVVSKLVPGQVYIVVQQKDKKGGFQMAVDGGDDVHLTGVFLNRGAVVLGKQVWRNDQTANYKYQLLINGYHQVWAQVDPPQAPTKVDFLPLNK